MHRIKEFFKWLFWVMVGIGVIVGIIFIECKFFDFISSIFGWQAPIVCLMLFLGVYVGTTFYYASKHRRD